MTENTQVKWWRRGESNYPPPFILRNLLIFRRRRTDKNGRAACLRSTAGTRTSEFPNSTTLHDPSQVRSRGHLLRAAWYEVRPRRQFQSLIPSADSTEKQQL